MTTYGPEVPKTSDRLSNFDRVKVDVAQTGFFEGREFRTFKELNVATGSTYVVKAMVPINIILFGLELSLETGQARLATVVGGAEGGSFAEVLPLFGRNTMTVGVNRRLAYVPQVVLTAGGTHTGGTEIDVVRVKTGANANFSGSVGSEQADERGVGAATYYFRLVASGPDPLVGVFKARWEERP